MAPIQPLYQSDGGRYRVSNLKLRAKFLAIAVPPLAILAVVVAYALKVAYLDPASVGGVQDDLRILGLVALAASLASALVVVLVARSVLGPLERLTAAADELSGSRLPALVEVLRDPSAQVPPPAEPLGLDSDDELGRLGRALDMVQVIVSEVTSAQAELVRQGVSSIVGNLARRNQALLDRQLELIDELESSERDPDRLAELYRLDHLATRMRRNAESLLVLAGVEAPRHRNEPVDLVDVLRVAMGEIEDYRHVELGVVHDAEVSGAAAVDLAHLLSELMENATQFSPPQMPVMIEAGPQPDGSYTIGVVDRGIGMTDQQLAGANAVLAAPPSLSLELSRCLGFVVMGRLAGRLGARIVLSHTPGGGVTARVCLPAEVVRPASGDEEAAQPAVVPEAWGLPGGTAGVWPAGASPVAGPAEAWSPPSEPEVFLPPVEPQPAWADRPVVGPVSWSGGDPVGDDAWAAPSGAVGDPWAPAGADAAGSYPGPAPAWEPAPAALLPPPPDPAPAWDAAACAPAPAWEPPAALPPPPDADDWPDSHGPRRLADALPEGAAFERGVAGLLAQPPATGPERTDAGLVRRRRGENLPPTDPGGRPAAASTRSPEEIRQMLARYRSGIKAKRPAVPAHEQENP
jgi:signal transduction histidine kinase